VVRPGLIVGPGDPTDRFGYWVARFAAAAAEPVLIPDAPGARVQAIDVDDLADFVVEAGRARFTGAVNAVGDSLPLEAVLAIARSVAGHTGAPRPGIRAVARRARRGVLGGERSLPLWLPDDVPGFATRANGTYRILGGRHRPLEDVLRACSPTSANGDWTVPAPPGSRAPTSASSSMPLRSDGIDLRRRRAAR
jgi:nucleoside-diphosphate-sugar epimerase